MRDPEHRLTTQQAAEYMHLGVSTLHNWRVLKKGPPYIKLGSKVFYELSALDQYMKSSIVLGEK